jgi:hypothetical protein
MTDIEATDELTEALDVLEDMVTEHLVLVGLGYHHDFAEANERACELLAEHRPDRWALTAWGLVRRDGNDEGTDDEGADDD